jgi:hypothetical protein
VCQISGREDLMLKSQDQLGGDDGLTKLNEMNFCLD